MYKIATRVDEAFLQPLADKDCLVRFSPPTLQLQLLADVMPFTG
jgi:hypothetical protein